MSRKRMELAAVKEYLDEHYTEKIMLEELAEKFFINKFYLSKIFKETYGTTVNNYLISKRITRAEQRLRFTDMTVDEVGVADQLIGNARIKLYVRTNKTSKMCFERDIEYRNKVSLSKLYIDGYLHDVHEAEDLMMETFSWLFTKKPRIRDGCFKAYLYKAARHMALRHKSRRRIIFSLDDLTREPEVQTLVEEVIRTKERNQILHLCMDELNPGYREALYLTYFEGMSYQQAAKVMGKSVKQITNMVYRGKERLRGLLKREGITNVEK